MKFNKKELQRLNCNDEEIALIMEYQKKLPILSENETINIFCVDARQLHDQLGAKKKFASWIKTNLKDYIENVDYITGSPRETGAECGRFVADKEYFLTIDLAKEIAMYTGRNSQASEELKSTSRMVRRYFLLMESIVKRNKDWLDTRAPQKKNYKPMCEAISQDVFYKTGVYGDKYNFSREANIMNRIATGCNAQAIKLYLGAEPNDITRDYLTKEYNERIAFLQEQNILLASMHLSTVDRVKTLIQFFNIKFPDATPIQDYKDRDFLLSQQQEIISELENI